MLVALRVAALFQTVTAWEEGPTSLAEHMEPDFFRHIDSRSRFLSYRKFFMWFSPAFLIIVIVVTIAFRERFPEIFPGFLVCSLLALVIGWIFTEAVIATSSEKGETWKVVGGRAIYESCSPLLGRPFDVAIEEIDRIRTVDAGECVEMTLRDGSKVRFSLEDAEEYDFYNYLKGVLASRGSAED